MQSTAFACLFPIVIPHLSGKFFPGKQLSLSCISYSHNKCHVPPVTSCSPVSPMCYCQRLRYTLLPISHLGWQPQNLGDRFHSSRQHAAFLSIYMPPPLNDPTSIVYITTHSRELSNCHYSKGAHNDMAPGIRQPCCPCGHSTLKLQSQFQLQTPSCSCLSPNAGAIQLLLSHLLF